MGFLMQNLKHSDLSQTTLKHSVVCHTHAFPSDWNTHFWARQKETQGSMAEDDSVLSW